MLALLLTSAILVRVDANEPNGTGTEPPSLGAVALDTGAFAKTEAALPAAKRRLGGESPEDAEAPDVEPAPRRAPTHLKLVVGTAIAGCVAILAAAAVRTATAPKASRAEPAAANAIVANEAAAAPPRAPEAPAPAPAPPPAAEEATPAAAPAEASPREGDHAQAAKTATLRVVKKGAALTVDGKRAKTSSVVVACGAHMVAVGAEKPRRVDAPCGKTIVVDASKPVPAKTESAKPDGRLAATTKKR